MNPGKVFEEDFRASCEQAGVDVTRLYDAQGGFGGVKTTCDFMVYYYPNLFYFELKSYAVNSIPLSALTSHQYKALVDKSRFDGVSAGAIFNYRFGDSSLSYFVPIQLIVHFKEQGAKSISRALAKECGTLLPGDIKRTRYTYHMVPFLRQIIKDKDRWSLNDDEI